MGSILDGCLPDLIIAGQGRCERSQMCHTLGSNVKSARNREVPSARFEDVAADQTRTYSKSTA